MSTTAKKQVSRRNFLAFIGWASWWGMLAAWFGGTALSLMPQVLYEPVAYFKAGKPGDYMMGVSEKWMAEQRVWIVRTEKGLYAFWSECRHLGCTPAWYPGENLFKCPCHGSNYDIEGDVKAGPAPHSLYRCQVSITPDGQILVNKAVKVDETGGEKRFSSEFLLKNV